MAWQSKPSHCEKATEEINVVAQKLITNSESDLQLSYAKQRRTKSSALLHKELDVRSNRAVRQYLVKVNQAIATLYARHVLASLLAGWPADAPMSEEALELSGASHMAYILDMLMQLEERPSWEKVRREAEVNKSSVRVHDGLKPLCLLLQSDSSEGAEGLQPQHALQSLSHCLPVHGGAWHGSAGQRVQTPVR